MPPPTAAAPTQAGAPPPPPGGGAPTASPPTGPPPKKPIFKQWWFWVLAALAALLLGGGLAAVFSGGGDDTAPAPTTAAPPVTELPVDAVTTAAPPTTAAPTTTEEATTTTEEPATTTTAEPTTTVPGGDLRLGDTATLADDAVARVNNVTPDAPPLNDVFPPSSGTTFSRLDVEECAGTTSALSNPILWSAQLDDGTDVQAAIGAGQYATIRLAPGGCQRGLIDVEVPTGRTVANVVRISEGFEEVGRWRNSGGGPPTSLLTPRTPPAVASPLGTRLPAQEADVTASSVTPEAPPLNDFLPPPVGTSFTRIGVELCATTSSQVVNPFYWSAYLDDGTIVGADVVGSALPPGELAPGQCSQGTVDVVVPAGRRVTAVLFFGPAFQELARWAAS